MSIMNSLFGGGNFPNQPTSSGTTVATSEFPKELAPFIKDILEKAKSMQSGATYQPYTGAQIAPFNALEKDAMAGLEAQTRGLAGTDVANAAQYFTGAKSAIEGLGQQFTGDTVQQFMNPYQQAVTDQAKLKATEDYEAQQNVLSANAIKNQPFGGSRQAITEGMAQGDYLDRLSNIQERGLAAGFTQGRAGFEAQKGRELQMANSLMGMGATVPQQAYRDLGIRQQIGETQRSQDQMALDLGTKQFMEEREFPTRALQEYSATVRGFPFQPSTYQTTTNYQPSPGIGQQLVNLAGQGLGGYTAFTGQPMQNLFKAEGGITTLPTYYNQRGENRQRSMYDISDLLEAEGGELDQYSDMEMDAMDIESYIDRKNKENLGDKILNMLYAPQRGMKRLFNVPERSQIGNRNRPNLNRAEGGITSLPVVYRDVGSTEMIEEGNFNKVIKDLLKNQLPKVRTPEEVERSLREDPINPKQGPLSAPMKPDGTPYTADELNYLGEQQMYPELEDQPFSPSFDSAYPYRGEGEFMEPITYNEEGGYPLMGAATSNPDEGIPGVINPLKDPANQIVNRLIPQRVYKDELQDYTNVPLETLPNIESFEEQGADYGKTIAESVTKTDLLNKLFDSMTQKDGSIPGLKQSIADAYSPARLESLRKTADSNLAMKQGLGMMKAFSKSDPTRGIISNLSSQVGDFATNVGTGQEEYASALAGIENMPFEEAQAIYNIDKDSMVNLGKLASDESLTGDKINFEALSADKKNLLDLINLKYTKSKDQALINQETNKINLLADLQSDENILKLYQMELTTNDNLDAAEAAMGKYNKDLVKAGVLKPSDSEEVRKILMKTLFGAQIDPETGDINMPNDKPLTMEQRKLYDQYYPMAIHDLGLSRMNFLYGVDKSDAGFSRVQLIANNARDLQTNQ